MAPVSNEAFLLTCINNSDLTKIDYKKVAEVLELPSAGAANKRFSRWKAKATADLANGDGEGDAAKDGSESPKKKSPVKKAAADGEEGTPKKSPRKKTPSKKRKMEEDAADEEAVKEEGDEAD